MHRMTGRVVIIAYRLDSFCDSRYFGGSLIMKVKGFLRIVLTIIFAFVGALVARGGIGEGVFAGGSIYFIVAATLAFGTLGFLLPDILEFAASAGVASLAKQIAANISPASTFSAATNAARLRFKRQKGGAGKSMVSPMVIDTSVLIDGRIVDLAKTGFLWGTIVVIPSVISELHRLSDNFDDLKRVRGRRGLDALSELQSASREKGISGFLKVELAGSEPNDKEVDAKLISLAKSLKGRLITLDFNLNKVAKVRGVVVLNVNELANALKTVVLPQDRLKIKVSSVGRDVTQGVGYLSDGTMVVIEGGSGLKGRTVEVVVHKVLQTAAGKMVFAKPSPRRES